MTIHRNLNKVGLGGNYAMWWLLVTLKAAGWTITRSGSGTGGVFDTADVFHPTDNPKINTAATAIGVGSGLEHFGNEGCWFVARDPGGRREYLFQRHATATNTYDSYWGLWLSPSAIFTGGAAATRATATDEVQVSNFASIFQQGNLGNLIHVAADDEPSPAGEYGFVLLELTSSNDSSAFICADDIRQVATGDPFALVIHFNSYGQLDVNTYIAGSPPAFSYVDFLGTGKAWKTIKYAVPWSYGGYYNVWGGVSKVDGNERPMPLICCDDTGVGGYLGISRWLKIAAVARGYPNTGMNRSLLYVDQFMIDNLWDGVSTPSTI